MQTAKLYIKNNRNISILLLLLGITAVVLAVLLARSKSCKACEPCASTSAALTSTSASASTSTSTSTSQTVEPKNNTLICYYSTNCGHCTNFIPKYDQFKQQAKKTHPNLNVQKVNCNTNSKACSLKNISSVPTVILYTRNKATRFNGDRTVNGLRQFCDRFATA